MSDLIPRCKHDNIILGCPEEVCDEQTVYLIDQETRMAEWEQRQRDEAKRIVAAARLVANPNIEAAMRVWQFGPDYHETNRDFVAELVAAALTPGTTK